MPTPARYTHGHHESVLRAHRWRTVENSSAYLLEHLAPGLSLLDVGCGPGTVTVGLAKCVAPGEVIGIDASPAAVDDARANLALTNDAAVRFEVGDVYALDFADASFDVVHAHQLLQHLADPVGALAEMRRICRTGGLVAARDADYGAMTWFPDFPELSRWRDLYRQLAYANGGEPDAGRRLRAFALQAGFSEVSSSASVWCYAEAEDRDYWGEVWAVRIIESSFAEQAIDRGLADEAELAELAAAWRRWAASEEGWFAVLHGEVLCRP